MLRAPWLICPVLLHKRHDQIQSRRVSLYAIQLPFRCVHIPSRPTATTSNRAKSWRSSFLVHGRRIYVRDTTILSPWPISWAQILRHCVFVAWRCFLFVLCGRSPKLGWIHWVRGREWSGWNMRSDRSRRQGDCRRRTVGNCIEESRRWMDAGEDFHLEAQW